MICEDNFFMLSYGLGYPEVGSTGDIINEANPSSRLMVDKLATYFLLWLQDVVYFATDALAA